MLMPNPESEPLKVAIIAKSSRQRLNLKSILETNHLQVVPDDELVDFLSGPNGTHVADVLLVDLDENDEQAVAFLAFVNHHGVAGPLPHLQAA